MPTRIIAIAGRTLLALLFILAGIAKIAAPQPVLDQMAAHHIPGILLPLVVLLELAAGAALLLGWRLRYTAGALALFCLATALGIPCVTVRDNTERPADPVPQGYRDCRCADGDRGRRIAQLMDYFAAFFGRGGPSTGGSDFRYSAIAARSSAVSCEVFLITRAIEPPALSPSGSPPVWRK